jgi:urease accessory protein
MLPPSSPAALLALADQRLPSGGHAHSGGVEQAITDGVITDVATLATFLARRLRTAGLVPAAIAAATAAAAGTPDAPKAIATLDAETDARTPSPAQRAASRAQGRGLLRLARAAWPAPSPQLTWAALGARPHHPIVLGCLAHAAGVGPDGAALATAYLAISGPATAAQRLLALDPVAVATVTLRLGDAVEQVAAEATAGHANDRLGGRAKDGPDGHGLANDRSNGHGPLDDPGTGRFADLPDDSDPLLDLLAERHAAREERLFAS